MANYKVVFVEVDGLLEVDVGNAYQLAASTREEAEMEARTLPAPEGANFYKLVRDGQFEPPKIGFAL